MSSAHPITPICYTNALIKPKMYITILFLDVYEEVSLKVASTERNLNSPPENVSCLADMPV